MLGVGSGWSAFLGGVVTAIGVGGVGGVGEVGEVGGVGGFWADGGLVGVAVLTAVVGVALLTTVAGAIGKKHEFVTVNLFVNLSVLQKA